MCLKLNDSSVKPRVATKDIIVFKGLMGRTCRSTGKLKHGDSFTGIVKGIKCSGKISFDDSNEIYLCTNKKDINGSECPDKLGYKYSWAIDYNVKSLIVNDVELISLKYSTPYRDFDIQIGEIYYSELVKDGSCSISNGLHSFVTLKDAKRDGHGHYVKCIIPKGSTYYEGKFGHLDSYASDKIKYIKIVK